jgi:hypothetical protein
VVGVEKVVKVRQQQTVMVVQAVQVAVQVVALVLVLHPLVVDQELQVKEILVVLKIQLISPLVEAAVQVLQVTANREQLEDQVVTDQHLRLQVLQ